MFLNVDLQQPGTHRVLCIVLQHGGEVILDAVLDIGFHHRGVEKMEERQPWHTFIPYTDPIPTASTTWAASLTTCPISWRWRSWQASRCPTGCR
jgi:NADH:ubiquinone oxidoreductase subunit D